MLNTKNIFGLLLSMALALMAYAISLWIPALGAVLLCLILGVLLRSFVPLSPKFSPGLKYSGKTVLALAVVLIGLKLKWNVLGELGPGIGLCLLVIVFVSLLSAAVFSKIFKADPATSWLVGIGSGICGSSAIAACSEMITNDQDKVATSLGVINFIGMISLFFVPAFLVANGVALKDSALVLGGSLQSLGHVAAASGMMGPDIVDLAMTIKMGRVFLLLPVILVLTVLRHKLSLNTFKTVPHYLWGFLLMICITNLLTIPPQIMDLGAILAKAALMVAMVGVGYTIDLKSFFKQAPKYMVMAILIQGIQWGLILGYLAI